MFESLRNRSDLQHHLQSLPRCEVGAGTCVGTEVLSSKRKNHEKDIFRQTASNIKDLFCSMTFSSCKLQSLDLKMEQLFNCF